MAKWTIYRVIGAALLVAASGAHAADTPHRRIVAAAFDRWSKGGTAFFQEILAKDVIWTIKGSGPSAGTFHGRDVFLDRAVKPFAARLARPIKPVVRHIWAENNLVAVQWDGAALARDGRAYRNSYVWIFEMQGRQARRVDAYLDLAPYDDVLRRIPLPARADVDTATDKEQ